MHFLVKWVHNEHMRTNINIADDARQFAEYYAQANGIPLGDAITSLIRKARDTKTIPEPVKFERSEGGFPVFSNRGRVITTQMVMDALAEEE